MPGMSIALALTFNMLLSGPGSDPPEPTYQLTVEVGDIPFDEALARCVKQVHGIEATTQSEIGDQSEDASGDASADQAGDAGQVDRASADESSCMRALASSLRERKLSQLLSEQTSDEQDEQEAQENTERALCMVQAGEKEGCELKGDQAPDPAQLEVEPLRGRRESESPHAKDLWPRTVKGRDGLLANLESVADLLDAGELARAQRLAASSSEFLFRFQRDLRDLNAMISGHYGLVVRGGISMGSYQAGFVYYLANYLRYYRKQLRGQDKGPFDVVTGSSAGGINAFAASVDGCRLPDKGAVLEPSESLFYEAWINLGLAPPRTDSEYFKSGLLDPARVQRNALLSSQPIDELKEYVRDELLAEGSSFTPECEVALGLTTTRLDPRDLVLQQEGTATELSVPHQVERFGFEVSNDKTSLDFQNLRPNETQPRAGVPAEIVNDELGERYAMLPKKHYDELINGVLDVVIATGAFPLAFAPKDIWLSYHDRNGNDVVEEAVTMVDGGTFDNHPFRFAARLRAWQHGDPGRQGLGLGLIPERPFEFIMLEPSVIGYPVDESKRQSEASLDGAEQTPALRTAVKFAGDFLGTARSAQLTEAADEYPYLRVDRELVDGDYLARLPARSQPIAGEQLGAFLAFAERDFRIFDFYVGMADARAYIENHPVWSRTEIGDPHESENLTPDDKCRLDFIEDSYKGDFDPDSFNECLLDGSEENNGEQDLTKISTEGGCKDLRKGIGDPEQSKRLRHHNFKAMTIAVRNYRLAKTRSLELFIDALGDEDFIYADLDRLTQVASPTKRCKLLNGKANYAEVSGALRDVIGPIADTFAAVQTGRKRDREADEIHDNDNGNTRWAGLSFGEMVLRGGLDFALDSGFRHRFDRVTLDLRLPFSWAHRPGEVGAGWLSGTFGVAGLLGGRRVGFYFGQELEFSVMRWIQQTPGSPGSVDSIPGYMMGASTWPLLLRMPFGQRKTGFRIGRGLGQAEFGLGMHTDLFLTPQSGLLARWGPAAQLNFIILRHLVVGVHAKLRIDGCNGDEWACLDTRVDSLTNHPQIGDQAVTGGVTIGWRFRPMGNPTRRWKKRSEEVYASN